MIDLYFFPTPNTWKVSIMLEECELAYRVIPIDIGKGQQFAPDFLSISPNNKVPAIVDHDGPGGRMPLFESGAILVYLADKTGRFLARQGAARYEALQWLFWQVGGLGPMAGQAHHFRHYAPERINYGIERYTREVARLYGVLESRLCDREWLAGDYSVADIACAGWVAYHELQGQDLNDYPHVQSWYEAMEARPGVQRGKAVMRELIPTPGVITAEARRVLYGR